MTWTRKLNRCTHLHRLRSPQISGVRLFGKFEGIWGDLEYWKILPISNRAMAPFVNQIDFVLKMLGVHEFAPSSEMMAKGGKLLCDKTSVFHEICTNVLFLLGGYNSNQLDPDILPLILQHTPAGSSVNQLVHFSQLFNSGKFRMFDHGKIKNLATYGQWQPPDYNLTSVTAPVFLYYSGNDWLCAVKVNLIWYWTH